MAFRLSVSCTKKYIHKMDNVVNLAKEKAVTTLTHHVNTLSKKKAITVFPPDRRVKYKAFSRALGGINKAVIMNSRMAINRISPDVL